MYKIYMNDALLHDPRLSDSGIIVIDPVLTERVNTHGSLEFKVAPSNPLYSSLEPRNSIIKVVSDGDNSRAWFGRVTSIEAGWNNLLNVYAEGELGFMCDSIMRPFGFTGSPQQLLSWFVTIYNGSNTRGGPFSVGNVSVTDPNNTIVRSSNTAMSVWDAIEDKLLNSSLGGYLIPRYDPDTDTHYIDYLTLDGNDPYAHTSSQTVSFGKNLLDFTKRTSTEDVITVLIPYGANFDPGATEYEANPPSNGMWDGNRLTVKTVNSGLDYIENADGIALWGRIVGSKVWDDVTIAANLLSKGTAWLAQQIWQNITLELSAVDLSNVDANIEQIQIGDFVRCISKPHDLNVLMFCSEKRTVLTRLEESTLILGVAPATITDLSKR